MIREVMMLEIVEFRQKKKIELMCYSGRLENCYQMNLEMRLFCC